MGLVAAAMATSALGAAPAAGADVSRTQLDHPSVLQRDDLAHRNDRLTLPADSASARPRAAGRTGPAAAASPHASYNSAGLQREVFGFAPYWALSSGSLSDVQWDKISTVSYFGLTLNGAGTFDNDAGMTGWNSAALTNMIGYARAQGDRVVVTIKCFNDGSIYPVVSNQATGQAAINNIIGAVRGRGIDGVNVDFEGTVDGAYPNIQSDFTNWVGSLSRQLHSAVPGSYLTLDAYSGSASWDGGFMNIGALAPSVDAFFIMAYDMYYQNAVDNGVPQTVPNAPLAGNYTYTDTKAVDQYLGKVGGNVGKIILGVPYYGYKWSTSNAGFNAQVTGGPTAVAYSDILSDIQCASGAPDNAEYHWDGISQTPWLSWYSPSSRDPCGGNHGSWRETYYDNSESLAAKYDLVNQRNIRGAGIWALGNDHGATELWRVLQQRFSGAQWAGWSPLGSSSSGRVAVSTNRDGRLEAFSRGADGAVWHIWQLAPGGGWSQWASLGGNLSSDPAVSINLDGRLEVFAVGTDNQLIHQWQGAAGGGWNGWYALGGSLAGRPSIVANVDGRVEAFARGTDNAIWHIWQLTAGGGWGSFYSLSGVIADDPAAAVSADGRLQVFGRGSDSGLWTMWQVAPGSGWTAWSSLGGALGGSPAVATNPDGRLEAFARFGDGAVWHTWQRSPNGGWSGFTSLGGQFRGDPGLARNASGRLEAFAAASNGEVLHAWQVAVGGGWMPWVSLGAFQSGSTPGAALNADGRLEIFDRQTDQRVWHDWQSVPNGGWN